MTTFSNPWLGLLFGLKWATVQLISLYPGQPLSVCLWYVQVPCVTPHLHARRPRGGGVDPVSLPKPSMLSHLQTVPVNEGAFTYLLDSLHFVTAHYQYTQHAVIEYWTNFVCFLYRDRHHLFFMQWSMTQQNLLLSVPDDSPLPVHTTCCLILGITLFSLHRYRWHTAWSPHSSVSTHCL